jgi:hypothetical protein
VPPPAQLVINSKAKVRNIFILKTLTYQLKIKYLKIYRPGTQPPVHSTCPKLFLIAPPPCTLEHCTNPKLSVAHCPGPVFTNPKLSLIAPPPGPAQITCPIEFVAHPCALDLPDVEILKIKTNDIITNSDIIFFIISPLLIKFINIK